MRQLLRQAIVLVLCGAAVAPGLAQAQQDPRQSRERELLRRQADQIRQLEAERNQLLGDKSTLEADLKKTRAEAAAASRTKALRERIGELEGLMAAGNGERDRLRAEIDTAAKRAESQDKQIDDLRRQLAAAVERAAGLDAGLKDRTGQLQACSAHNTRLAQVGQEILDKLTDGRCKPAAALRSEPLLQFGRVRFERELERYRDKVAQERYFGGPK